MNEKWLAFLCQICPLCAAARLFPKSAFAAKLREVERDCPACRAYRKLHSNR